MKYILYNVATAVTNITSVPGGKNFGNTALLPSITNHVPTTNIIVGINDQYHGCVNPYTTSVTFIAPVAAEKYVLIKSCIELKIASMALPLLPPPEEFRISDFNSLLPELNKPLGILLINTPTAQPHLNPLRIGLGTFCANLPNPTNAMIIDTIPTTKLYDDTKYIYDSSV